MHRYFFVPISGESPLNLVEEAGMLRSCRPEYGFRKDRVEAPAETYKVCKYVSRSLICSSLSTLPNPSILLRPRRMISPTR